MKKKSLETLIVAFALIGGWCFIVGIANSWFMLGSLIFGGAASVTKLFHNVAEN